VEMISNYMLDEKSRHMLNDLTRKTFGFDFEGWVTNGYFGGEYIPYSLTEEGRMLSNVSVNRMKFMQNGEEKYYIQIGTVMTDEDYRKQGLASRLIKYVIAEYENDCDGIYLFGNLDAVSFYEKMGFKTLNEYRYTVKEEFLFSHYRIWTIMLRNIIWTWSETVSIYLHLLRQTSMDFKCFIQESFIMCSTQRI